MLKQIHVNNKFKIFLKRTRFHSLNARQLKGFFKFSLTVQKHVRYSISFRRLGNKPCVSEYLKYRHGTELI